MFVDVFEKLCKNNGVDPTPVLVDCGMSPATASNWMKKRNVIPDGKTVIKIAKYFNVSTDLLLLGEETGLDIVEQSLISDYRNLSHENQDVILSNIEALLKTQIVNLPCCSETTSAGIGVALSEYATWETKTFVKTDISQKADFVLIVNGDSMEPDFSSKDYVLVRSQPVVDIEQIGIFYMDGKGYIKKYGGDCLISLNPKYPPLKNDADDFRCYGLVLGKAQIANLN